MDGEICTTLTFCTKPVGGGHAAVEEEEEPLHVCPVWTLWALLAFKNARHMANVKAALDLDGDCGRGDVRRQSRFSHYDLALLCNSSTDQVTKATDVLAHFVLKRLFQRQPSFPFSFCNRAEWLWEMCNAQKVGGWRRYSTRLGISLPPRVSPSPAHPHPAHTRVGKPLGGVY